MARTGSGDEALFALLYQSDGPPKELSRGDLTRQMGEDRLLWIDLEEPGEDLLKAICGDLGFPDAALAFLLEGTSPAVGQEGEYFWVRCVAVRDSTEREGMTGTVLTMVAGKNRILSFHALPIRFVQELRESKGGYANITHLCAESFVAILLDRQLATYFQAVSDYEGAIERLEVDILSPGYRESLPELRRLRRWASRLRRMLAPHRNVFGVMSRPDFRPTEGREADRHFVALDTRFERAMDMVENARELVIGSFDLFSNQTALRTNEIMRVLTFVTVVTGMLATVVGALGMNFDAAFFKTQDTGFWAAALGLVVLASGAFLLGRMRRWL